MGPNKQKVQKTDLSITVLLLIGILVVINFFSYQVFYRFDLTQNKIYSISDASKQTVSELDDVVNIKAYFSESLPSQLLTLKQEVGDLLDEYQSYSNGKIRVEFINPGDSEQVAQELAMKGIPQLTFQVYEKDKMQLVNGYLGIVVSYGGKDEVIPAIKQDTSGLEYQMTTAIIKATSDDIATVGFLSSHGTNQLDGNMSAAKKNLEELYSVRPVELLEENPQIQSDIDTLIIAGPKEEFSEAQLEALNSFVMRGGSILALLDGVDIGEGLQASKNASNLNSLLEKYGIKANKDLAADTRSGVASFTQGFLTFSSNYPYWPMINQDGFDQDNSTVANLESVVLPWVSTIDTSEENISEEEKISTLIHTTDRGWRVGDNFNVAPNTAAPQGVQKEYALAVMASGQMKNAYPSEDQSDLGSNAARIIVVGDSDFATNNFVNSTPDNMVLFQNLVDSLSLDDALITIRSKTVSSRPINESLSESGKTAIRYINVLGLTLVVVLFGLIRYFMRRRSRFVDDL